MGLGPTPNAPPPERGLGGRAPCAQAIAPAPAPGVSNVAVARVSLVSMTLGERRRRWATIYGNCLLIRAVQINNRSAQPYHILLLLQLLKVTHLLLKFTEVPLLLLSRSTLDSCLGGQKQGELQVSWFSVD